MDSLDYWKECISDAAGDCDLKLTPDQLHYLARSVEAGHDTYGMAFYSPPAQDRISEIEREWKDKVRRLETAHEQYRENAETAIKKALRQHSHAQVSIEEFGEVLRYDGRTEQIQ